MEMTPRRNKKADRLRLVYRCRDKVAREVKEGWRIREESPFRPISEIPLQHSGNRGVLFKWRSVVYCFLVNVNNPI